MTYVPGPNASKQDNPLNIKHFAEHAVIADGHTPPENTVDKDTNPKDTIGSGKLPLSLVPSTLVMYASLAFLEGALKYGRFNWRVAGVRSSIYIDALERHLAKYKNGEDIDPHTSVPHLSSMLACLGILVDAKVCDKLNDDRPPRAPIGDVIDEMAEDVGRLKAQFKDHHPHQYTIADSDKVEVMISLDDLRKRHPEMFHQAPASKFANPSEDLL